MQGDTPDDDTFEAEREAALRTIRKLMAFHGLTPRDLRTGGPAPAVAPPAPAAPKYRHPVSGATWDGQGAQPDWLRQALLKEGLTVEELRVPED